MEAHVRRSDGLADGTSASCLWTVRVAPAVARSTRPPPTSLDGERVFRQHLRELSRARRQSDRRHRSRPRPVPRAMSDDDLVRIIRNGIPNTPMPASNMTEAQAAKIVAYLRSRRGVEAQRRRSPATPRAARRCSTARAPARPAIASTASARASARISAASARAGARSSWSGRCSSRRPTCCRRTASIASSTKDGATVTGRLLNHDTFTVQLLDTKEQLRSFVKVGRCATRLRGDADAVVSGHAHAAGNRRRRQLPGVAESQGQLMRARTLLLDRSRRRLLRRRSRRR